MCSLTKRYVKGSFAKYSQLASSYRGKLLGMLAIHLFLLAIKEHYMVTGDKNQIFCDNLGAIYTFQRRSQRVTSGAKNADIQRVLRQIQNRMTSPLTSKHARAHQDDGKKRLTLSIEAQLNCRCDDRHQGVKQNNFNFHTSLLASVLDNHRILLLSTQYLSTV